MTTPVALRHQRSTGFECRHAALRSVLVAAFIVAGLTVSSPSPATAAPTTIIHHLILGDSYSAGNGAGNYQGMPGCYRSSSTWGALLDAKLRSTGATVATENHACNGAIAWDVDHEERLQATDGNTNWSPSDDQAVARYKARPNGDDSCPDRGPELLSHFKRKTFPLHSECKYFLRPQTDWVTRTTNLVTMTMGGNDLGFADVVGKCFVLGLPNLDIVGGLKDLDLSCRQYVDTALNRLRDPSPNGLEARLRRVLSAVSTRMDPSGVLEYLGYPSLIGDVRIDGSDYPEAASAVRAGQLELEALQQKVIDGLNAAPGQHPRYVFVPMTARFYNHEILAVGASTLSPNPDRWFQAPTDQGSVSLWYHPDNKGHEIEAEFAYIGLGPLPSRPIGQDRRALDLVFVIDTTASMTPFLASVKQSALAAVNALDATSDSWRVAVVSYRDFVARTNDSRDYPSRVIQGFSTDKQQIIANINGLTLGNGGDNPETMYSGLMTAFALPWRPGVEKRAVVMTDAAALNPEPFTGYTADSVAGAALALDPAQVIGISAGGTTAATSALQAIVDRTGGTVTSGSTGAAVVTAIQTLNLDPIAVLSSPSVVAPGESMVLDASGSVDPLGSIIRYRWDINGDGRFDSTTTVPTLIVRASDALTTAINVKVDSSSGRSNSATTHVTVSRRPGSSINPSGAFYEAVTPVRALDTRTGVGLPKARLRADQTLELPFLSRPDLSLPSTVNSVALNVTVDQASGPGFVTVWPCGQTRPLASNLNYSSGATIANMVVSAVGSAGKVCFYSQAEVDLIVDLNGYFPELTDAQLIVPTRVLDSRAGLGTTTHRLQPQEVIELQLTGAASPVPSGASVVLMNVTVDRAGAPGYVTVWPCGRPRPLASNLNYSAGMTVPNLVASSVGAGGKVCLYTYATVDLIADVSGYLTDTSMYSGRVPTRLLDTRTGLGASLKPVDADGTIELAIPPSALPDPVGGSVALNVTVDRPAGPGFVTVWPCGSARPLASNLNFAAGATVPNLVVSGVPAGGRVCLYASARADLVVDLEGAFTAREPQTGVLSAV
jgi:hypothetical protein